MNILKQKKTDFDDAHNARFAYEHFSFQENSPYSGANREVEVRRKRALQRLFWRRQQRRWGGVAAILQRVVSIGVMGLVAIPLTLVSLLAILAMRIGEWRATD